MMKVKTIEHKFSMMSRALAEPQYTTQGIHLLAALLPDEGWVLFQVEVGSKENEIPATGRVLKCLDLRGKITEVTLVITGDVLLAQRELSLQIVQGGGEYVWIIKDNQPKTRQDIERLFAPEPVVKGFSPAFRPDRGARLTTLQQPCHMLPRS